VETDSCPFFVLAKSPLDKGGKKNKTRRFSIDETPIDVLPTEEGWGTPSIHPPENGSQRLGPALSPPRLKGIRFLSIAVFLLFVVRAVLLQTVEGSSYRYLAEGNRSRLETVPARRGIILDRRGVIVAENIPSFVLTMRPNDLPQEREKRDALLQEAADLANLQRADFDLLLQEYAKVGEEDVVVDRDLPYDRALLLMTQIGSLPGFSVRVRTKRRYAFAGSSLAHLLGYTGKMNAEEYARLQGEGYRRTDEIGKTGVEQSMEGLLRGQAGTRTVEVDAFGTERTVLSEEESVDGQAVILATDAEFQVMVETALDHALQTTGQRRGSAVAVDPRTGEILALVSLPSYDDNLFAGGVDQEAYASVSSDPNQPLFPRAVAGQFPSGSTFKPFLAASALAEGIITPSTSFLSVGGLRIGPWFFPDWKSGGHGVTDVRKALAESVNTFFYIVGGGYQGFTGLGVKRIVSFARLFGFGSKTGIDLPGEANGFLPSEEWKQETKGEPWYVGDTYHLAIGQGDLLVTPLQMAVATGIVANGGTRWKPHVVKQRGNDPVLPEGTELPENVRTGIKTVREGLRQAVTQGSARALASLPAPAAGKTGTAQVGGDQPTHAWFTGFFPYDNPDLALTILIENGGEGSSVAVPVAKEIFQWWYDHRMNGTP